MSLLQNKTSKTFLPLTLAAAVSLALIGCNGDSDSPKQQPSKVEVDVSSTFTALLMGRVDHNSVETNTPAANENQRTPSIGEIYIATLTATNTVTGEEQSFEWPFTLDTGEMDSQKTISIEPGSYNFTLSAEKGSQQYVGVLTDFAINDTDEVRLPIELEPSIGNTIVDILYTQTQLSLNYPASELVGIDVPQVGVVINGEEHIFAINTSTGISDVILNIPAGAHEYDIKLYNGNILIGRSEAGPQNLDIAQGDTFNINLISLQADATVDITGFENKITFRIPKEIIDRASGAANTTVHTKLLDTNNKLYQAPLSVQEVDGQYYAEYIIDFEPTDTLTADLNFENISTGEFFASCKDVITIGDTTNTMDCGSEMDYSFDGNLLATLAINVLSQSKEAQAGAKVYVDGELAGITGSNFGTDGFVKVFVKAGESHLIRAEKDGLEDSETRIPTALSINNFDLILDTPPIPVAGKSCLEIIQSDETSSSGVYKLDPDGDGPIDSFQTFCDMDTERGGRKGGWTLVQNRINGIEMTTTYNLKEPIRFPEAFYPISMSDDEQGAISNEAWATLKTDAEELLLYSGTQGPDGRFFYTELKRILDREQMDRDNGTDHVCETWSSAHLLRKILFHVRLDAECAIDKIGSTAAAIGSPKIDNPTKYAHVIARNSDPATDIWIDAETYNEGSAADPGRGTAIFIR